jgi:hypothetical protein
MGQLVDTLYDCWRSDPVHGDKSAYAKIALGLLDFLADRKPPKGSNKRSRTASSPIRHQTTFNHRNQGRQDWQSGDGRQQLSGYGDYNNRNSGTSGNGRGGGRRFY